MQACEKVNDFNTVKIKFSVLEKVSIDSRVNDILGRNYS